MIKLLICVCIFAVAFYAVLFVSLWVVLSIQSYRCGWQKMCDCYSGIITRGGDLFRLPNAEMGLMSEGAKLEDLGEITLTITSSGCHIRSKWMCSAYRTSFTIPWSAISEAQIALVFSVPFATLVIPHPGVRFRCAGPAALAIMNAYDSYNSECKN